MNDIEKVKKDIIEFVINEFIDDEDEAEDIDENSALISSGIVDSFSMVSLKRFLEKKFELAIPDAKATPEAFDTVNNIIKLIDELKG